ncbi:MAG: hypothetical protein Ta2B_15130 [Termitinemataceae bacterium]|nr:MAG: hypothetical protein Ta2B_15130 [Termitinemataceae bacterium]
MDLEDEKTPFVKADIIENLDDIPCPDWEQMEPNSYPLAPEGVFVKHSSIGLIITSRGCPYSCKFCSSPNFCDRKVRFRSPKNIIGEMKFLIEKYNVKEIQFLDDNLTVKKTHVEQICNFIIDNNLKISMSCPNGIRADKVDLDMIKLMKKAGFYYCALGIESANKTILQNIDKKESIETIQSAIKMLSENGIIASGSFIFGLPGETKETIKETMKFALTSGLERAHFGILSILPGCDLWNDLEGKFVNNYAKKIANEPDYIPDGLTSRDLIKAQSTAFRKFYLRPKIFFKAISYVKPRQITSFIKRLFDYRVLPSNTGRK